MHLRSHELLLVVGEARFLAIPATLSTVQGLGFRVWSLSTCSLAAISLGEYRSRARKNTKNLISLD